MELYNLKCKQGNSGQILVSGLIYFPDLDDSNTEIFGLKLSIDIKSKEKTFANSEKIRDDLYYFIDSQFSLYSLGLDEFNVHKFRQQINQSPYVKKKYTCSYARSYRSQQSYTRDRHMVVAKEIYFQLIGRFEVVLS